jgi:hypothetical protein
MYDRSTYGMSPISNRIIDRRIDSSTVTSLGTVNLVAPIDRNFIDISAIIRLRLCTFELPIE